MPSRCVDLDAGPNVGSDDPRVGGRPRDDLVPGHEAVRVRAVVRRTPAADELVGRYEAEGVPAILPAAAERRSPLEDDVLAAGLAEVPAGDQTGLARADDDGLDRRSCSRHRAPRVSDPEYAASPVPRSSRGCGSVDPLRRGT